jgi:AcrR family transcriptional regulator
VRVLAATRASVIVADDRHPAAHALAPRSGLTFPGVAPRSTSTHRRAGRPRREGLDEAILDATLDQLARVGYSRMSLATIAQNARTTKPTIYARWPSKAELAAAALGSLRQRTPRHPSGELRADLIEELALFRRGALRANGMSMLGAVLVEQHENPELLRLFRKHVVHPRRENLRHILNTGLDTGQLHPDSDIELAITMFIGSLYASCMAGVRTPQDWPDRIVDAWLRPNGAHGATHQTVSG